MKHTLGPRANFFSLFWRFDDRAQNFSSSDSGSSAPLTSLLRPSIPVNPFSGPFCLRERAPWSRGCMKQAIKHYLYQYSHIFWSNIIAIMSKENNKKKILMKSMSHNDLNSKYFNSNHQQHNHEEKDDGKKSCNASNLKHKRKRSESHTIQSK